MCREVCHTRTPFLAQTCLLRRHRQRGPVYGMAKGFWTKRTMATRCLDMPLDSEVSVVSSPPGSRRRSRLRAFCVMIRVQCPSPCHSPSSLYENRTESATRSFSTICQKVTRDALTARFFSAATPAMPSSSARSRKTRFPASTFPSGLPKSHLSHTGIPIAHRTKSSSRKGNRTSRPQ